MHEVSFQESAWYRAIPLSERIALFKNAQGAIPNLDINTDFAQRLMQRWKSQSPFTNDSCFVQRLTTDEITEEELFYLLGEPIDALKNRFPDAPNWLIELAEAFSNPTCLNAKITIEPEKTKDKGKAEFLYAIKPLIIQGIDRLHQGIQELIQIRSNLPFDPSTVEDLLFTNLKGQLLWMLSRTMILELNVARLQGLLKGETPEERFGSFLQRLQQPEVVIPLLQEYPVLARQLVISIKRWVNFSLEFLQHLCNDWDAICTTFSPKAEPGLLVQIDGGRGDTHRGGRSVLIAKFSSGFQVVYKPKPLAVDIHFQELLEWLNQRGNHPSFRTLKIINRGTYGWVEFFAVQTCTNSEEIQRFYERQGAYLALLYALEATDFHNENLIATGENPILIDLESLFHPRIENFDIKKSDELAINTINYSVLRVGLLPQRIWINAESEGIELSGLGGKKGQLTPTKVQYVEGTGTDEMRVARKRKPIRGSQNQPTLNESEVNVLDYTEAILTGFTSIYQLLLQHRNELLSENSPLTCFASDEVRFIMRPTQIYGTLLHESFHPDLLRNALDRDQFFDRLWRGIEQNPYLAKVIATERNELWEGDIPMFSTRPNSRDLWTSYNERIPEFFDESGMNLVKNRLQELSEDDLTQQLWFIRASLTTLAMVGEQGEWPNYHLKEPQNSASREQLLAAAQAVGDRLETLALQGEQDVSWIGLMLLNQKHWTLIPLGMELYHGLPGIILFLAYLGTVTEQKRYTEQARAALITLQRQVESSKAFMTSIGGFEGWGGVIYTLTHLGVLWNDPDLLDEAELLVELLPNLIEKEKNLDIIAGAAGCIGSLISLYRCRPSQRILAAAIECGNKIVSYAQTMEQGVSWQVKDTEEKPLSGFSHGAAGMAWALLELASVTGDLRFRTTALSAIEYERSLFCPEVKNWTDLRYVSGSSALSYVSSLPDLKYFPNAILSDNKDNQHICMMAWCHGAPGIGLARLRCLQHLDDAAIRAEINTALQTTLTQGFGHNHSLCHGDLGNLELLLQASLTLDDPQWKTQVDRLAAIILESIDEHGWLCGVPLGVETPGLMTGLAGIGYGLLRLAEPERVPSVLVLEPPKLKSSNN
ncbi:type 2 lantipeptide synthetase LanM [Scytonema tolypothrichoides VB-61278]|nr:type 2 lantipeptide synthetase LanM [Scytonema tolypothrichoides VB-61278]